MKLRLLTGALILLCTTAAFAGEPLTDADRAKLLAHLDRTSAAFLASVDGLSEAQWNYRAGEGRWTVAEVAEHIAASEKLIRDGAAGAMTTPATAEVLADARKDDAVLAMVPNREKKFKATEPLVPTNRFKTPAETLATFKSERAETVRVARDGGDLRSFASKGPIGNLDVYGQLLFLSAHTERHTKQIEEVKADAGFPKQ